MLCKVIVCDERFALSWSRLLGGEASNSKKTGRDGARPRGPARASLLAAARGDASNTILECSKESPSRDRCVDAQRSSRGSHARARGSLEFFFLLN